MLSTSRLSEEYIDNGILASLFVMVLLCSFITEYVVQREMKGTTVAYTGIAWQTINQPSRRMP